MNKKVIISTILFLVVLGSSVALLAKNDTIFQEGIALAANRTIGEQSLPAVQGTIIFFYGDGCPHCALVEAFFEQEGLYNKYPIEKKEIYFDRANALLYNDLLTQLGVPLAERGVPAAVIGQKVLIGDGPIVQNFIVEADQFLAASQPLPAGGNAQKPGEVGTSIDLTVAAVIAAAAVDAINPCEFAVLIILMTAILATGNAKRALKAGLAFSLSMFLSYFFMGFGLYKALVAGGMTLWFYQIIGWLAIALGLFNLKDYFWYGKVFLMEVPLGWRPKLKSLLGSVTSPLGAFGIGFLVSLFLLPCTSGPYIVILGMLAKKVFLVEAVAYLLLYNLIFILPMILITFAVYKGFNPATAEAIRQKRLRTLHLIAGLIMLAMGVVVLMGLV